MDTMTRIGLWTNGVLLILFAVSFFFLPSLVLLTVNPVGMLLAILLISIPIWGIKLGRGNRYDETFTISYRILWTSSWLNLIIVAIALILLLR